MKKELEENILKSLFNKLATKKPAPLVKKLTDDNIKNLQVVSSLRGLGLTDGFKVVFPDSKEPEKFDLKMRFDPTRPSSIKDNFKNTDVVLRLNTDPNKRLALQEVISLIVKEELSKAALEKQPHITVPVKLYLDPEQTTVRSAESVATIDDNEFYKLSKDYDAGNELANQLVGEFAKEISSKRAALSMSTSDMKAFLIGKTEELRSIPEELRNEEIGETEAREIFTNLVDEIKIELERNLYNVPRFLKDTQLSKLPMLIKDLEATISSF